MKRSRFSWHCVLTSLAAWTCFSGGCSYYGYGLRDKHSSCHERVCCEPLLVYERPHAAPMVIDAPRRTDAPAPTPLKGEADMQPQGTEPMDAR